MPNASNSPASTEPTSSAPARPNAGAHCECDPSDSTSGPIRVPIQAPNASPANASTPLMKPCAKPNSASSSTRPTMIQSTPVTDRAYWAPMLARWRAC